MLRKNISNKKKIPLELYKKILETMPIFCVDILFKSGDKAFLFKRAYEPAKSEWWLIGGRVLRGETLKGAVIRKVKEEVGVEVNIKKMIGIYEHYFPITRFDTEKKKKGAHMISACYLVEPTKNNFNFKLSEEYTAYKSIKKNRKRLHPYVKRVLKDSGFR